MHKGLYTDLIIFDMDDNYSKAESQYFYVPIAQIKLGRGDASQLSAMKFRLALTKFQGLLYV